MCFFVYIEFFLLQSWFVDCDLLMPGQGNAGPEVDSVVKRDLVNMRAFHMEYDCCSVSDL